jgi:hypothetical protein
MRPAMLRILLSLLLAGTFCAATAVASDGSSGGEGIPTKAQAVAFAHAVNLTAADLPGFTAAPHKQKKPSANEQRSEAQLERCLGRSRSKKGIAEVDSDSFEQETSTSLLNVSSEVTVVKTPALAAHALALIKKASTRACVSRYFNLLISGLKTSGAKIGKVKLTTGTPPAPGTGGSFGWRLSTIITAKKTGAQIPFSLDILGFINGRAAVTLLTSGLPQPFPATGELELFSLLVKRATTTSI